MIVVDADATPDLEYIIEIAYRYNIDIILVSDNSHDFNYEYAKNISLSTGSQNADMYIINNLNKDDILITQDIPLASLALNVTKKVMNTKGLIYSDDNIDELLLIRHLNKMNDYKHKIKKRNKIDTQKMLDTLISLIIK